MVCFALNLEIRSQSRSVIHQFFLILLGRDLCKNDLKDLITFSTCYPLHGNLMNNNCFSGVWLLFSFVKLFSLLVILLSLLLLFMLFLSCCFSTCVNICSMNQRVWLFLRMNFFLAVIISSSKDIL